MRLYIDDVRETPAGFDLRAFTFDEAIELLQKGNITHVSFDHDLGDDDVNGTGYDIASWIEECAYFDTLPKLTWEIHSANPVGRKNIEAAMKNADRYWSKGQLPKKILQLLGKYD